MHRLFVMIIRWWRQIGILDRLTFLGLWLPRLGQIYALQSSVQKLEERNMKLHTTCIQKSGSSNTDTIRFPWE
jgi:hypothetical protein